MVRDQGVLLARCQQARPPRGPLPSQADMGRAHVDMGRAHVKPAGCCEVHGHGLATQLQAIVAACTNKSAAREVCSEARLGWGLEGTLG